MKALKRAAAALAVLGLVGAGQAHAACPSNGQMNQTQLNSTFPGNTVCAVRGSDRWQEFHQAGGALIDWKMGPGHAVDPTKQVGSWSVNGTGASARMVYNYGSGGTYSYRVVDNGGGAYSFCNGDEVHNATVRLGQQSCGF
ncbi:hypothetical protein [Thauera sp. WH-1]|uniref:hypothetical protein n=1 Tax=Thauera sp. WH-1 TaxID=3398230 RepID=UPI0039FBE40C